MSASRLAFVLPLAITLALLGAAPAAAQWQWSGNNIFFDKGRVGIGFTTPGPGTALWVQTKQDTRAIYGYNTLQTGSAYGVAGYISGPGGAAVEGVATSAIGKADGVFGHAASPEGYAVRAQHLGKDGGTAVYARSSAPNGVGVYGESGSLSGFGIGVHGVTFTGQGVRGTSYGSLSGVLGESSGGTGVTGFGKGTGVWGSGDSTGVSGFSERGDGVSGSVGPQGFAGVVGYPGKYGVFSNGDFGGSGAKYFVQPHPEDPAVNVRFVCLEGNESGTYFRGTARLVGGLAEIEIPQEWMLVSEAVGITVQVTPLRSLAMLTVMEKSRERIVVAGSADCEFDYTVNGVRRGYAKYQPFTPNDEFRPTVKRVPYGAQYPEAIRAILVQNGTLNHDLTPNETTAARLGWELRDPDEVPVEQRTWLTPEQRR